MISESHDPKRHKTKNRLCANYKAMEGCFSPFMIRTVGANCKECVYFSSKNCGVDLSKGYL